ncbi:unnamed protein product [Cylicocyclus nassatus]|uniref:Uncharacterized protein n=1 Tax=Cylicocyclus nassatus TaxID=53992 RepID=A0AA36DST3_CYLNA|nr:unnamed protein product [Cylicocyclus nassatus]
MFPLPVKSMRDARDGPGESRTSPILADWARAPGATAWKSSNCRSFNPVTAACPDRRSGHYPADIANCGDTAAPGPAGRYAPPPRPPTTKPKTEPSIESSSSDLPLEPAFGEIVRIMTELVKREAKKEAKEPRQREMEKR